MTKTPVTPEPEEPRQESLFDSLVENENKTTDLAIQTSEVAEEQSTLANFSGVVAFDSQDLIYPRVRLAQALTAEVMDGSAKAGQFVLTGMTPQDSLILVPGMFARRRLYANNDTQDVLCRSSDAVNGVGTPGGRCDDCPLSHWSGSQEEHNRKPPVCTFMYSYIVFIAEWETVGILDFRKTSLQTGKTVNTMAAHHGLGNFAFQLKAISQTNQQKQRYYVMTVLPFKASDDLLDTARQFFQIA
jgi:hypothetical protein